MKASAVPIALWARGWWLVGSGPSYLLFRAEERRVMHLTTQLPPNLRVALKGFQAVGNGRLVPLMHDLSLIDTKLLRSPKESEDRLRCERASFSVLCALDHLIHQCLEEKSFKKQLARITSNIKAAHRFVVAEYELGGGPKFTWTFDMERSTGWIIDSLGREIMMVHYTDPANATTAAKYRFRCVPHSGYSSTLGSGTAEPLRSGDLSLLHSNAQGTA